MKALMILLLLTSTLQAEDKMVATVKMIRGKVFVQGADGLKSPIKQNDKINEGALISTEDASFAQLRFIDNSIVNVGPKSEMKIEQFSRNKPGLLSVVKGEIRSQVTKDYLDISKTERDKLYVKSKSAAMGIRGTDFIYSYNPGNETSTAVLLEGEVAFARVDANAGYEDIKNAVINDSITMYPGEFSIATPGMREPSVPAVLNLKQRDLLVSNHNNGKEVKKEEAGRSPASAAPVEKVEKSIVPPGLNSSLVANSAKGVEEGVKNLAGSNAIKNVNISRGDAKGFVKDGVLKPANGSIVHIQTGVIIPPSEKSQLDKNTNSYISSNDGKILSDTGDYKAPKDGAQINEKGQIVYLENGQQIVKNAPVPVLGAADNMQLLAQGPPPVGPNEVYNPNFIHGGDFNNYNNQQQNGGFVPQAFDQNSTLIKFNIQVQ